MHVKKVIFAMLVSFLAGALAGVAQQRPTAEGAKPYTPSRLEWLSMYLEGNLREDLNGPDKFSMDFIGLEQENTLLINIRYSPDAEREIMNLKIETAKKIAGVASKSYGWSSWLRLREDVKMETLHSQ
jgi:hypothetical protein